MSGFGRHLRSDRTMCADTVVPSASAQRFACSQTSSGTRTVRSGVCWPISVDDDGSGAERGLSLSGGDAVLGHVGDDRPAAQRRGVRGGAATEGEYVHAECVEGDR